ncbi:hypothetical protein DP195_17055 [Enterobacter asburiae]|nr:hypothetical protein DP195_17055 [Enterobacter asburiae]
MMNPVPWLQMTNMISYQGLVRTFPNVAALTTGCYEAVKIDRAFYRQEVQKSTFNVLMKNIMKYCPYVIVEGVEQRQELPVLRDAGVTAVQGYLYRSVPFDKIHNLI